MKKISHDRIDIFPELGNYLYCLRNEERMSYENISRILKWYDGFDISAYAIERYVNERFGRDPCGKKLIRKGKLAPKKEDRKKDPYADSPLDEHRRPYC